MCIYRRRICNFNIAIAPAIMSAATTRRSSKRLRENGKDELKGASKKKHKKHAIPSWLCEAKECKNNCEVQDKDGNWICAAHWASREFTDPACYTCGEPSDIHINGTEYCNKCRPNCLWWETCYSLADLVKDEEFFCQACAEEIPYPLPECDKCGGKLEGVAEIEIDGIHYCKECHPICQEDATYMGHCINRCTTKRNGKFWCADHDKREVKGCDKCGGKLEGKGDIVIDGVPYCNECRVGCQGLNCNTGSLFGKMATAKLDGMFFCDDCIKCGVKGCNRKAQRSKEGRLRCDEHFLMCAGGCKTILGNVLITGGPNLCYECLEHKCGESGCLKTPDFPYAYEGKDWCGGHALMFNNKTKKRFACTNPKCDKPCATTIEDGEIPVCSLDCFEALPSVLAIRECKNCGLRRVLSPDEYCRDCCDETKANADPLKCQMKKNGNALVQCDGPEVKQIGKHTVCVLHAQAFDTNGNRRICYGLDCFRKDTKLYGGVPYCSDACMEPLLQMPVTHCATCFRMGVGECSCAGANHCIQCCWKSLERIKESRQILQCYLGQGKCEGSIECKGQEVRVFGGKRLCVICMQKFDSKGKKRKCVIKGCGKDGDGVCGGLPVCSQECGNKTANIHSVLCDMCGRIGAYNDCLCEKHHCRECCKL